MVITHHLLLLLKKTQFHYISNKAGGRQTKCLFFNLLYSKSVRFDPWTAVIVVIAVVPIWPGMQKDPYCSISKITHYSAKSMSNYN